MFVSPYIPELKPIETAFSLVISWIRDHEQEGILDPVAIINRAHALYSVEGEWGFKCYSLIIQYLPRKS